MISYALWALAGFRLVFPFSFESVFSLIPFKTHLIPLTAALGENVSFGSADGYPVVTEAYHTQVWLMFGSYLWIIGIAALLIYSVESILLLNRRLSGAVLSEGNIYEAENLKTPFVLGFIRPKIYIPLGLSAEEKNHIILHEQTHIKRFDHVVKFVAFLILCVHWFNPLVWAAFMLMNADMEMSCDECVVKEMGSEIKKGYSASLLSLAMEKRLINGSPLAFGEGNIKGRIENVLNFKKPAGWIIVVSIALVAVLGVGLAANRAISGTGDYDFYNFYVNGFMLGADTKKMDTSSLTPTAHLDVNGGYDFNFEEVRYSADEETGRLRKMCVNVCDDGVVSMLVARANGKNHVSLDSNQTYQIEGIEAILGKGKTGWHDREQRLRYMEYHHKEGRLSATVRFVYMDKSKGIPHRLIWVIAESSLPYPYPYPDEKQ